MKLMMFVIARYGIAAVMSPATASGSVGRTFDCASSFAHVRLPSRMSPKRCTSCLLYTSNGRRVPPTETLMILGDFYDVSIDYILKRTENPKINR